MKRFAVLAIWLGFFLVDGVILPSFSEGGMGGLGTIIFLISFAVSCGTHRWVIGLGLILAFISELFVGAYFGTIMMSWLVVAGTWYLLNKFFSLKSGSESNSNLIVAALSIFGVLLFIVSNLVNWLVTYIFYSRSLMFGSVERIISSPVILSGAWVELIMLLIVFRLIYSPSKFVYN